MEPSNSSLLLHRILTWAALPMIWIGAYCVLGTTVGDPVFPPTTLIRINDDFSVWSKSDEVLGRHPRVTYRFENTFVRSVFWPIHQLDRLVRPKHWQYVPWTKPSGVSTPIENYDFTGWMPLDTE